MSSASVISVWLSNAITVVIIPLVLKVIAVLVIWFVGVKLIQFARKFLKNLLEKGHADKGVISFLDNFVKFGLYALLIVMILQWFGIDTTGLAAVVASAGVAIGLALQGSLSNLAGGVLILLLKPFKVGDYIIASGLEGVVSEIQMFSTKLITADNRVCVIPNGTLSNGNIVNVTALDKRRIDIPVGVSYDSDLKTAKAVLTAMIMDCPYTLKGEANDVFVSELADSSVVLNVRAWVKTGDFWPAKAFLTENIKLTLDANHIEIPFNQVDVHMAK